MFFLLDVARMQGGGVQQWFELPEDGGAVAPEPRQCKADGGSPDISRIRSVPIGWGMDPCGTRAMPSPAETRASTVEVSGA